MLHPSKRCESKCGNPVALTTMAAVAKTLSYPVLQDARLPKFLLVLINLLKLEKTT